MARTKGMGIQTSDKKRISPLDELGVAGVKMSSGYVYDEYLTQLVGDRGRKTYREMRDNDAIVGAVLFAVEMLLRAVDWDVESPEEIDADKLKEASPEGEPKTPEDAIRWMEACLFEDMTHTWEEFISMVLSMLTFGWQYTEVVYKMRRGPDQKDTKFQSKYNDGLVGVRKLADRSQETLYQWEQDENGKVTAMIQQPPVAGEHRTIPLTKALLFKPHPFKGSPEGRSVLRSAYRSWYFLKNLQEIEGIAIERELNGLPVVYIPNEIMVGTSDEQIAAKAAYVKMVRDIKLNDQGGVVLPSNLWQDADGKMTSVKQVELQLLNAGGTRAIDINVSILRYQQDIARTILADFIMLGSQSTGQGGSYALSEDKSEMFQRALQGWLKTIASTINRYLVPKIWDINGFNRDIMPYVKPGRIDPVDLEDLGIFIERLARAGAPLFPDDKLEESLRDQAGLPQKTIGEDGLAMAQLPTPTLSSKKSKELDEPELPPDGEKGEVKKQLFPGQIHACNLLNSALKSGTVVKPKVCDACKKKKKLQAHHGDYTKALKVKWYCQSCHAAVHGKTKREGIKI